MSALDPSYFLFCCEFCKKNKYFRKSARILTFALILSDMITDWMNWSRWSKIVGYNMYSVVNILTKIFLGVAIIGTVLVIFEMILLCATPKENNDDSDKRNKCFYRMSILILILIGLLEDFPVVITMFYASVTRICGAPVWSKELDLFELIQEKSLQQKSTKGSGLIFRKIIQGSAWQRS